jgi:hypothetical protein
MDLWCIVTIVNYTRTPLKISPLKLVVNGSDWPVEKVFFCLKSDTRDKFKRISLLGDAKEDYELHFIFPDNNCPLSRSGELLVGIDNRDQPISISVTFS